MTTTQQVQAQEVAVLSDKVTLAEVPGKMITNLEGEHIKLNLNQIWIDPKENIRRMDSVTQEEIEERAASIYGTGGLLQDLGVVRIKPSERNLNRAYGLAFGFIRSSALKYLGEVHGEKWITNIPCKVLSVNSLAQFRIIQLAENLQRTDINAIEKARAIKSAMDDPSCTTNQGELASIIGISPANLSQLLSLMDLPMEVQDMIEGVYKDKDGKITGQSLSFSHARLLQKVPKDKQLAAAKAGLVRTYAQFEKYVEAKYGDETTSEGSASADATDPSQRSSRLLTATDIDKSYLPFAMKKAKEANSEVKNFTERDLWARVLDTIKTIQRDSGTALAKDIAPFLKLQAEQEEKDRIEKDSGRMKEKFLADKIKFINQLLEMPPNEAGKRPYPELSDALKPVVKQVIDMTDEAIALLGFPLEKAKFQEELFAAWTENRKQKMDAKEKKRLNDEKKAAEKLAADKLAAEKAAAAGQPVAPAAQAS